ncbi:nicotinate phosphoribosyltransferase [Paenibacillus sp. UNCCL117]|uniref:nicotinate phosphoribosyltransferase n=1 Tax=unclassified Paenibacillus TaxID=185978 RepID=UPI0008808973|nr:MULTISPECIES: nicotinate phosphoribosyltransferase [unclassified Paenibacillus]SDE65719.1 nicotinate phosphoribosyltransferase [Paenibacillus sp. cl123]SFW70391.1 nicotinate phosphoribosyltransferase [Paenibacillus sp. UNCCL117]
MQEQELTLHTDKYQINMMYAHWKNGSQNERAVFEAYFRKLPFGNGYAVAAGLERIVRYVRSLRFEEAEIAYLRTQEEQYEEGFLEALREFRFTGSLYAVPEGTLVFPNVPLVRVEARVFEAQLIETALLNCLNFQTLIATKAARIKQVAGDDTLLEFGTRRAQEADAAVWGARAAYLAGFHATSNMRAGMLFGIPAKGTHAHAWVQGHRSEEEAFRLFAEALPDQVTLLVDTYDTLRSGVPNAIKTAKMLEAQGKRMQAIRLDSGDMAYLSKKAREMLDEAGLSYVKIVASNDLDENIIFNLKAQGARIDSWGVGTQLITGGDQPALGGVYKLVACERDGEMVPVIKISANPEKVTNPGLKEAYRIVNRQTGKAEADYLALMHEEDVRRGERIKLFDPIHPYIHKFIDDYEAVRLLQPVFEQGELVYELPALEEIRRYHQSQLDLFWPEYLRKLHPEVYPVDLSTEAWELKMELIRSRQEES